MFDEAIVSYVLGELDSGAAAACEARIAASSDLASAVERLRSVLSAMADTADSAPTPQAVRRAKDLWARARSRPALWERVVNLRYLLARLVFDGRVQPALAGYRAGAPASYQMAYECDATRVDLQVTQREKRGADAWAIHGRVVVPSGTRAGRVALCSTDRPETLADTAADGHGRFSLQADPGVYDLLIELGGDGGMVIPDFVVGALHAHSSDRFANT